MKAAFAGLAAAAVLAVVAGSQSAQAMPIQKQLSVGETSAAPTEVRYYRRHYVRRHYVRRHYWGGAPYAYYGGYYPYRSYAYPYPYYRRHYWGGGPFVSIGPLGFGFW